MSGRRLPLVGEARAALTTDAVVCARPAIAVRVVSAVADRSVDVVVADLRDAFVRCGAEVIEPDAAVASLGATVLVTWALPAERWTAAARELRSKVDLEVGIPSASLVTAFAEMLVRRAKGAGEDAGKPL